ncbi:flagellar hook-length control protein FliK [Roseibium alexandrii]|uniref:Flagellar hook-length control protein FliK n=1 Tax=Roseibium alexandrii TaxID=388408 RepID=A0A0M7AMJ7_9HYPH|nr:flagellar hook-length control protein FliK [Roseibium alexandrii]CTQ75013.1 Flagellar hook-length control protein FliK [Roseibium alexandrii]
MTVTTHAMIRTPSKAPVGGDGNQGEGSKNTGKDVADQFRAMMSDLTAVDGNAKDGDRQSATTQGAEQAATGEETAIAVKSEAAGKLETSSFSVTNLTDAIRKASQTVLGTQASGKDGVQGQDDAATKSAQHSMPVAAALPLGTVLAAHTGQGVPQAAQGNSLGTASQNTAGQQTLLAQNAANSAQIAAGEAAKTGTSSLFAQFGIEPERVGEKATGSAAARNALPEEAAGTVKVLRQETHFAPNMRLSPAQQVGEQIATALKDMPVDTGRTQGGLTHKAEGPVLKTLEIQLTPHELGTVKVSLRMVGENVEVTLATSKAQTAELLKQDRQLLDQMLRTTGFKADAITIQAADDRPTAPTNISNSSSTQGQQGTNGGAFGDQQNQNAPGNGTGGRGEQAGGNDENGAFPGFEPAREQSDEDGPGNRLSDGIYM